MDIFHDFFGYHDETFGFFVILFQTLNSAHVHDFLYILLK